MAVLFEQSEVIPYENLAKHLSGLLRQGLQ